MLCAEVGEFEETLDYTIRRLLAEMLESFQRFLHNLRRLHNPPGLQRSPSGSSLSREKDSRETFMGTSSLQHGIDPIRHQEDSGPTERGMGQSPGSAPFPPQREQPSPHNDFLSQVTWKSSGDSLLHSPGRQRSPSRSPDSSEYFVKSSIDKSTQTHDRDPSCHMEDIRPRVLDVRCEMSPRSALRPPQREQPPPLFSWCTSGWSFASVTVLSLAINLGTVSGAPQGPGDMLITCPTTKDLNQTKDGFVILPSQDNNNYVLSCDWLAKDPHTPDCISHNSFSLMTFQPDRVVARGPWDVVHRHGSFNLQLLPADGYLTRTPCLINPPDITSPLTTLTPEDSTCGQQGTVANVMIGLWAFLCLLLFIHAIVCVWCQWKKRKGRRMFRKSDTANGTLLCPSTQSDDGMGKTEADMEEAGVGMPRN